MSAPDTNESLSFEERLTQLEVLVDQLESGELGLEQGVDRYRQGVELLSTLQKSLASAEQKVAELTQDLRRELAATETDDDTD
ncbi:MAG: exodeoxyribonuclease VII small subunit [Planctomycetes bacterium]|nr:exodeoxyribonuclease VII small subunit [Planctomycetota bacterium]MBT4028839.1 exodeoxyribonuclease VII small subunit [Planctomycetota bacterium]MBT4559601.1 exodeoxyribonuclease VII small subunit [Planctomycetota bacterium]MBT5100402.1 exodeoxyribonuclease VII small subunit [Planctomycetota bacterium]MBT5121065.1 exodeoxyribonuclease VII small subunit [Planctomycetota bacterium]